MKWIGSSRQFWAFSKNIDLRKEEQLFIFEASPELFCEDVIRGSTFPVYADLDVPRKEAVEITVWSDPN